MSAGEKETPDDYYTDNRYKIAKRLLDALEAYYNHEGCYPPYLFGGGSLTVPDDRGLPPVKRPSQLQEIDPLLQGGYLKEYPSALSMDMDQTVWNYDRGMLPNDYLDPVMVDPRGWDLLRCMYSTPGDYTQLGLDPALFADFYERYPRWRPGQGRPPKYDPNSFKLTAEARREALGGSDRLFALGGMAQPKAHRRNRVVNYRIFPGNDDEKIRRLFSYQRHLCFYDELEDDFVGALPFFGYQRGEWNGADESEAWLWFYGSNLWLVNYPGVEITLDFSKIKGNQMEALSQYWLNADFAYYPGPPLGLDLLNAQTGELTPDGIPDGICLLCRLSHGKLVEVIDAGI